MNGLFRVGGAAAAAAFGLAALFITQTGRAQPAPMPLLTDTPHYCAELSTEVEATRKAQVFPAPAVVERLAMQGRELCSLGEIQGGILRLRRAIVLLHENTGRN